MLKPVFVGARCKFGGCLEGIGKHLMLSQPPNPLKMMDGRDCRSLQPVANKAKTRTGRERDMWPGAWTGLSQPQLETQPQS